MDKKIPLFAFAFILLVPMAAFAAEQSHPLTQIHPMNTSLNLTGVNITNVSYIYFGNNSVDTYLYRSGSGVLTLTSHLIVSGGWINGTNVNATSWINTTKLNISGTGYAANFINYNWLNTTKLNVSNNAYIQNLTVEGNLTVDSGTLFVDSNLNRVGIGTVSPAKKLSVASSDYPLLISQTSGIGVMIGGKPTYGLVTTTSGANLALGTNGNNVIMTLENGGNVGINALNPGTALEVNGTIRQQSPNVAGYTELYSTGAGGFIRSNGELYILTNNGAYDTHLLRSGDSADALIIDGTTGEASFQFNLSVDSPTFFVDSFNDRVGIGTTSPSDILTIGDLSGTSNVQNNITLIGRSDVAGSAYSSLIMSQTLDLGSGIEAVIEAGKAIGGNNFDTYLAFKTTTDVDSITEHMRIDHNGNVGIGTAAPDAALDVNGITYIRNNLYANNIGPYSGGGSTVIHLSSGYNVGIGTTTPTETLSVVGDVNVSGWVNGSKMNATSYYTKNLMLTELNSNVMTIRDAADTTEKYLYVSGIQTYNGLTAAGTSAGIQGPTSDGRMFRFWVGSPLIEVARMQLLTSSNKQAYFNISRAGNIVPLNDSLYNLGNATTYFNTTSTDIVRLNANTTAISCNSFYNGTIAYLNVGGTFKHYGCDGSIWNAFW